MTHRRLHDELTSQPQTKGWSISKHIAAIVAETLNEFPTPP
ncbi:MAG: hypothetical protein OEV73_12760 [Desulfobulbaceae bacterium]|nr:hypothetical protein [Desulfobulbaceae bacterium]